MSEKLKTAWASVIVLSFVLLLVAAMLVLCRRELTQRETEAAERTMVYEVEMDAAAEKLREDRDAGDEVLAVHHALNIAEYAARAGLYGVSERFDALAEDIQHRGILGAPVEEALEALRSGTIPEGEIGARIAAERTVDAVLPKGADERAESMARQLLGETVPLRAARRDVGDRLCYTCRNGYAVIDRKTGMPVEFALSLEPGEDRLTREECAENALRFLAACIPAERLENARVEEIRLENGFADVKLGTEEEGFYVKVKRDTGRICEWIVIKKKSEKRRVEEQIHTGFEK